MMVFITAKTYLVSLQIVHYVKAATLESIKTPWVRFRHLFMLIIDAAIETLDVTPMKSRENNK